jgi:hyaluronate lyase
MKIKVLTSLLAGILLAGCNGNGSDSVDTTSPDTDYQLGLKRVQELYLAKDGERSNVIYQSYFDKIHSDAKKYADSIEFNMDDELWPDLPNASSLTDSQHMHFTAQRLKTMSQAYVTPGTLYLDQDLLKKIIQGVEQFVDKFYVSGGTQGSGWYEYQIGIPRELLLIVANLDGYIGETLKAKVISSIDTYLLSIDNINPYPYPGLSTGANRVDQAWDMLVRGFVNNDSSDIVKAKEAFVDSIYNRFYAYANADTSSPGAYGYGTIDSFKRDNSYVFHGDIPYSNGYGLDLLNRAAEILLFINGTEFDFSQVEKDKILDDAFERVFNAYMPWLKDGLGLDATAGRAVFRGFEQNSGKGQWAIEGILKYYELADLGSNSVVNAERKSTIAKFAKSFLTNDSNYYARYGSNSDDTYEHDIENYASEARSIQLAKEIIADSNVPYVKESIQGNLIYPEMDRVVHRTGNFTFAVASHSSRTGNFEIVGGEGSRGCYSADGMTYIYDDDLEQYKNYWVAFDADRPSGVTNDASSPDDPSQCGWSAQTGGVRKSEILWSGGVSAGSDGFGIFGMDYKDWHWTGSRATPTPYVEAKKSWFMFGDTILAVGSDIKCNDGCDRSKLETTIDNRKLSASGGNTVQVNGVTWNGDASIAKVNTIHISGNVDSSELGIVFPTGKTVDISQESRSGDWITLSQRAAELMRSTFVSASFLRTSLSHQAVDDDSYAYVLLPGKNTAETTAYAANPTLGILINSNDLHAVYDSSRNVFAMNVFAEPSATYIDTSANLIKNAFAANGNVNLPLDASISGQLLNLATAETFYGADSYVRSTGDVSLMSKLNGDELTVWVSQPTRRVMSAVLDVSGSGYKISEILAGSDNVTLGADGTKCLVKFDLVYTMNGFEANGLTYKLKFKMNSTVAE